MLTIVRYTLLTAIRDWLFIGLLLIIFAAYGMANFVGDTAMLEEAQITLAYFAGASRAVLAVGLIVFICFHVMRAKENREIEATLSRPISRTQFIIAYWLGFIFLAVIAILPIIVIISFFNKPDLLGLFYWCTSLVLEVSIVSAFALLSSLILESAVASVLASFAFYITCRLMGFFVAAINEPTSLFGSRAYEHYMEYGLEIISTVVPRLDLFVKSEWLIYGVSGQQDLWIFPVQSLVYIPFLLAIAIFDFKRKQF